MTEKLECQCDSVGVLQSFMASLYDPVTELPFVDHQPNKCKGTSELEYRIRNGKKILLCSCCTLSSDKRIEAQ